MKRVFFTFLVLMIGMAIYAQQLSFPGAEGSGRFAEGGRGGSVYEVTNLSNSGAGSIVDAVSSGNRTIVFRVSGTISLGSVILEPKSNTTIAGQTAPGDGICIKGRIKINASDIIIRHLRVRVDAGAANSDGDAIDIVSGNNIIIDHVTASYARDEGISCQEDSDDVTVQWCIISEGLTFEGHSFGSLIRGDYGDQKTYHHNLYAHNQARNPRPGNYTDIATDPEGLHFDFRNNVVYNWAGSKAGYNADDTEVSRYNFVGNAYIKGPESGNLIFREASVNAYGYFMDNSRDGITPEDPWSYVDLNMPMEQGEAYKLRSYEIPMEPVTTTSPEQAKTDVLASAGASIPKRDTIDRRIVNDVLNKTGHSIDYVSNQPEGGWPILNSLPAPTDTDHDGMPNEWEKAHGLDTNNAADRNNIAADGYTMLEKYLNSIEFSKKVEGIDISLSEEKYLMISWANSFMDKQGYIIERATSEEDFSVLDTLNANSSYLVDSSVTEFAEYKYRVKAFNTDYESLYSSEVSSDSVTKVFITSPASGTRYTEPADITIEIDALASVEIDSVQFFSDGDLIGASREEPFTLSWTEVGSGEYSITAIAYDSEGNSSASEAIGITVQELNSIFDKASEDVLLYPNPVSDKLIIKLNDNTSGYKSVTLYSSLGKVIMNENLSGSEHILNMESVPDGVYIIILSGDERKMIRKIIKN